MLRIEGSDATARKLIYDLLALATLMISLRNMIAEGISLSGPQYSIFMGVGRFQGTHGVSTGAIAKLLCVSPAFVTTEVQKLIALGLLHKRRNPNDRRKVLLSVSQHGRMVIESYARRVQWMNDGLLARISSEELRAMSRLVDRLVKNNTRTLRILRGGIKAGPARRAPVGEVALTE